MPARAQRAAARRQARPRGSVLTLAVYHQTAHVEQDVAPLRRAANVEVRLIKQGTVTRLPVVPTGVLFELAPGQGLNRRQVARLLGGVPSASYGGAAGEREIEDLARTLGFRHHLSVPLRLAEVERALGLPGAVDLTDRLESGAARLEHLAARVEVYGDLVRALNASTDPAMVASALVSRLSDWMPSLVWSVVAVEPDGGVRWLAGRDVDEALRAPAEAIADVVVQHERPYVTARVAGDARIGEALEAAAIGWPIAAFGNVVGVLVGIDHGRARREPKIASRFRSALTRLLEPAGFALAHALRAARAEALSVTDDLTQLYNARYLHEVLRKEVKRAVRSGRSMSLLFVDLDGFKRINDAHGHLLGSRALVEAAAIIRSSARETDIVARFGGDEFAVVLPETTLDGARAVARRIRERIAKYVFLAERGPGSRLTASIGVATLPEAADTAEGLLEAADVAMYRVKEQGKDGTQIAGDAETDVEPVEG